MRCIGQSRRPVDLCLRAPQTYEIFFNIQALLQGFLIQVINLNFQRILQVAHHVRRVVILYVEADADRFPVPLRTLNPEVAGAVPLDPQQHELVYHAVMEGNRHPARLEKAVIHPARA